MRQIADETEIACKEFDQGVRDRYKLMSKRKDAKEIGDYLVHWECFNPKGEHHVVFCIDMNRIKYKLARWCDYSFRQEIERIRDEVNKVASMMLSRSMPSRINMRCARPNSEEAMDLYLERVLRWNLWQ